MKLTICSYDGEGFFGGPFTWLQRIVPLWQEKDIDVRIIFFTHHSFDKCPSIQYFKSINVPFIAKKWHSRSYYRDNTEDRIKWILKDIESHPPDIFVPNLVVPALYAGRWVKEAGIPTVGILHSDDPFFHGVADEFVFGRPEFRLSQIVCVSKVLLNLIKNRVPEETAVTRIPYYIPFPEKSAFSPNKKLKLVYAGRLVERQKQISLVINALCKALLEIPDTEAYIYGDGPARADIETTLKEYGPDFPLYLKGVVPSDRLQDEYFDKNIFVMLSDYEGLPIALLEAMAAGLVPVCLKIRSGIPELVRQGETGILVTDRGDNFVKAIRSLKNNPEYWKSLSEGARRVIQDEYGPEITVDSWITMFEALATQQNYQGLNIQRRIKLPPVNKSIQGGDFRKQSFIKYIFLQIIRIIKFIMRNINVVHIKK